VRVHLRLLPRPEKPLRDVDQAEHSRAVPLISMEMEMADTERGFFSLASPISGSDVDSIHLLVPESYNFSFAVEPVVSTIPTVSHQGDIPSEEPLFHTSRNSASISRTNAADRESLLSIWRT
jgi:hypothetical protein